MELSLYRYMLLKLTMLRRAQLVVALQHRYLLVPNMLLSKVLIMVKRAVHNFARVQHVKMTEDSVNIATRNLGFEMCRDSIGGIWSEIAEGQFQIKPLSGGLTNYLYICSLPSHVDVPDNQPRSVLLRVYGDIATSSHFVVQNSVIFALMSEKGLGPRLYGMNPQARIEELLPCKPLSTSQLTIPSLSVTIAKKLARFHKLDMPVCKEPKFLTSQMDSWMVEVKNILRKNHSQVDQPFISKLNTYRLEEELDVLKGILSKVESKVVFCHNDLQEGNILCNDSLTDPEEALTVIDWEYCAYNYRGFDFGNHFCEWTCNYAIEEAPYYSFIPEHYPKPEQQRTFFRAYLTEQGEEITDSVLDSMIVESDTYALASHFFWGLWSIIQSDKSAIQFGFLEYADSRFSGYFSMKQKLTTV